MFSDRIYRTTFPIYTFLRDKKREKERQTGRKRVWCNSKETAAIPRETVRVIKGREVLSQWAEAKVPCEFASMVQLTTCLPGK